MLALIGILGKATKSAKPDEIAFAAYEQAHAMLEERSHHIEDSE
jgi:hypothetical protein